MDIKIALAGNPNRGKATLFNALTGSSQYVGNWPGVTVEKKEDRLNVAAQDLPGNPAVVGGWLEAADCGDILTGLTAYSLIFNLLCAPCFAAVAPSSGR